MSSDDPFGGGGGDWGNDPQPLKNEDNIDMNYGQPLPPQGQPAPGQPGQVPPTQMQPPGGGQLQQTKPKLENDDIIAMVLTFFLPGVGHMMLGQTTKGIVILVGTIFTCGVGYMLTILFAVDAYLVAMTKKYRQVDDWEVFPDMNKHLGSG